MATSVELYNQADQLKEEGKLEDAIQTLQNLLEQDPNYTLAYLALAKFYGMVGKHEEAVRHGQKACELEPEEAFNFTAMSVTFQRAWQGTQNQEYIRLAEDAMAQAQALEARN